MAQGGSKMSAESVINTRKGRAEGSADPNPALEARALQGREKEER